VSLGVSFNGDTPLEAVFPYLPYADYVQVMGIHTIGVQGQPFSERALTYVEELKRAFPKLAVSVDGSVNEATIARVVKAGADRLIVGSAIVGQSAPAEAYETLRARVNEA
jgi:ribulose-phosphate 3-epimerase